MQLTFYKYEGTGNDFVMIDNRNQSFPKADTERVRQLCDRRFGIGADGLILLEDDTASDFKMIYYNSDGNPGSMCGNGGRCIAAFAKQLGLVQDKTVFSAADGLHHAEILSDGRVSLEMADVAEVRIFPEYVFLDTGSPHHVQMEVDLFHLNVKQIGSSIRYSDLYGQAGSNINFVKQVSADTFAIRTYERGVEDETLSCGTGATATAIAMHATGKTTATDIAILVQGGQLSVSFEEQNGIYTRVLLSGPATNVFKGQL